jgi:hypothetical protein
VEAGRVTIDELAGFLMSMGRTAKDQQAARDVAYLEAHGWCCLGEEASTGVVHWTTLARGAGQGGPVTFQRALWLQRTADRIAAIKKEESAE